MPLEMPATMHIKESAQEPIENPAVASPGSPKSAFCWTYCTGFGYLIETIIGND